MSALDTSLLTLGWQSMRIRPNRSEISGESSALRRRISAPSFWSASRCARKRSGHGPRSVDGAVDPVFDHSVGGPVAPTADRPQQRIRRVDVCHQRIRHGRGSPRCSCVRAHRRAPCGGCSTATQLVTHGWVRGGEGRGRWRGTPTLSPRSEPTVALSVTAARRGMRA